MILLYPRKCSRNSFPMMKSTEKHPWSPCDGMGPTHTDAFQDAWEPGEALKAIFVGTANQTAGALPSVSTIGSSAGESFMSGHLRTLKGSPVVTGARTHNMFFTTINTVNGL